MRPGFFALLIASLLLPACSKAPPETSTNRLALGDKAPAAREVPVNLAAPANLNGYSIDDILAVRRTLIEDVPSLIEGQYVPWRLLFNAVDASKPWRSLFGVIAGNPSEYCGTGPALESIAISNPLLLAVPRFWSLTPANPAFKWAENKSDYQRRTQSGFPLIPKPQSLVFYPAEKKAILKYNLSRHIEEVTEWLVSPIPSREVMFSLGTYNARDFGFTYAYIPPCQNKGISVKFTSPKAFPISDYPMTGRFKNPNQDCNTTSQAVLPLRKLALSGLPAQLHLWLWIKPPGSALSSPDLDFIVELS